MSVMLLVWLLGVGVGAKPYDGAGVGAKPYAGAGVDTGAGVQVKWKKRVDSLINQDAEKA